jgi:hypothetical protein
VTSKAHREAGRTWGSWVCDGCGAEVTNYKGWLSVYGHWDTSEGGDTFHGDFCQTCSQKLAVLVYPLSTRNRGAGVQPRIFG